MTVRPPADRDVPAIRRLQSLLAYADPDLVHAAVDGPFRCRVAVEDGSVVGYAVALSGDVTVLSELVVSPDHRRRGHGRALVDAVAGDADRVEATTPADDAPVAFYGSLGFSVAESIADRYADGADALRLVRGE